jgi:O-methyltransferase
MHLTDRLIHTARLLGPQRFVKLVADRLRQPNPIRPWQTDQEFLAELRQIAGRTLVDPSRLYVLFQLAKRARSVPGAVAEIGVYRGGTAKFLSRLFEGRKPLFLFDTFAGMPDTHPEHDFHRRGDFADTSLESVQAFLSDCRNVAFHPGFFPETAVPVQGETFSLVHVDVDIYESVKSCCEFFFSRLAPGGVMVFDDYGMITCPGAKRALDEFCAATAETPLYLPTGQCLLFARS